MREDTNFKGSDLSRLPIFFLFYDTVSEFPLVSFVLVVKLLDRNLSLAITENLKQAKWQHDDE